MRRGHPARRRGHLRGAGDAGPLLVDLLQQLPVGHRRRDLCAHLPAARLHAGAGDGPRLRCRDDGASTPPKRRRLQPGVGHLVGTLAGDAHLVQGLMPLLSAQALTRQVPLQMRLGALRRAGPHARAARAAGPGRRQGGRRHQRGRRLSGRGGGRGAHGAQARHRLGQRHGPQRRRELRRDPHLRGAGGREVSERARRVEPVVLQGACDARGLLEGNP
mmetsp:Transcript_47210/g.122014  ORF Transcript_47210/g.122014 Transcript_47210/m.122014 type:complete len:218 (+) Transcript_47210:428-1081(+)